ncbi:MAG TPA: 3-phosphoserine/phosphohydroxythreonine transaminase [Saprospiraceae bacterium]|nr:3-phosphoserine/phosphohydroxythreonine transaminase [Saprospiraceae bacterium]
MKKHNFSSGPAILPESVFAEAAQAVKELPGEGLSILEISHRSKAFTEILEEACRLPKELLGLDDQYEVLYLTGGASSQFYMVPMNILGAEECAGYIDTGAWSVKAIKEAKLFGSVEIVASSKVDGFTCIPKDYKVPEDLKYLHITSNNTIYGTQFHEWPGTESPLVGDMSSDIFSRPTDLSRFGLIYAGAQKNLGPAGTTLVIVRKDMLGKVERPIPTMLDYRTHVKKNSAFNTPPVFPIYVAMLNLRWIKAQGGLEEMARRNQRKAALVYEAIDTFDIYSGVAAIADRSLMNATFFLNDHSLDQEFLSRCTAANISTIKGHRSVGGFRASMYNAMPYESVEVLVDVMDKFGREYAGKA